ncbi:hypothetical protein [Sphingomonas sp. PAMC 26617]|uniref:hypothetical protein n=1 Tax=Sphingomonas sp. PAMC 26617 TaxID=1112216 RepID=UPI0002896CE6|nr:hypothetical protein [Sphingomonas sp. PAMC 26617]
MSALAKLRMVQVVLLWAWDPIGVRGIPEAVDEYDSYAPAVLELLESGASDQHIADYLTGVTRDRMELRPNLKAHEDIAAMLRELYAIDA